MKLEYMTLEGARTHQPVVYTVTEKGCWECVSHHKDRGGYPRIYRQGRNQPMSHVIYAKFVHPVPDGMDVLHHCDNPACINPEHLFIGDDRTNTDDKVIKGRQAFNRGERNGRALLSIEQTEEIRVLRSQGLTHSEIALLYGVARPTVSRLLRGETWKPATNEALV